MTALRAATIQADDARAYLVKQAARRLDQGVLDFGDGVA